MIPRWLLLVACLLLALAAEPATAKGDKPKVSREEFDHPPYDLFYFEGTNTIVFRDLVDNNAHISFDGGKEWEIVKGTDGKMRGSVAVLWRHPYDKQHRAYALGEAGTHWVTTDAGKTWEPFKTGIRPLLGPGRASALSFNGWDPRKVILSGEDCTLFPCLPVTIYTTDDFKTQNALQGVFWQCIWAAGTPEFGQDLDLPESVGDRILCVMPGLKGILDRTERLAYSDN